MRPRVTRVPAGTCPVSRSAGGEQDAAGCGRCSAVYEASHGLCRPAGGLRGKLLIGDAAEAGGPSSRLPDWHSSGGRGNYGRRMANRYEYTVVELREGMIGGKMSGDKLENVLNEHAAQGWQLKAITSVEVRGRVGPGGVEGLLVTFERPVG